VGDGSGEVRGFARLDGRPVVGFQVVKTRESSDVTVDDAVRDELKKMEAKYPGLKFTRIFATVDETRSSFHATQNVLMEGMILAALVVLFFLRDWRATLITAFAMPVSLIPTFFVMQSVGFSLNVVTLLALTLVIGILVDDAIVEIENIEKRVAQGQRPFHAAMVGADAIGLAVVATTAAIVVVFTPVSFMPGIPGQFFREFGLTVSVAVLFSLVVARLLTPLMAAYFLKPSSKPHARKPFEGRYRRALDWALDHRIAACVIGGLLFFASLALLPFMKSGFIPPGDPDYVYVSVEAPPGTTAETMEGTVAQITRIFHEDPAVTGVFAAVGGTTANAFSGSSGGSLQNAQLTILLKSNRHISGEAFRAKYRKDLQVIPDARVSFLSADGTAGFQQVLTGDDSKAIDQAAYELERQMRGLTVLADPRPASPPSGPEIVIRPRAAEAARLGVSVGFHRPGRPRGHRGRHRRQRRQAEPGRAAHSDPHPPAAGRAHRHRPDPLASPDDGARRHDDPGFGGRCGIPGRPRQDQPAEPRPPSDGGSRAERHRTGPGGPGGEQAANHEEPAQGRPGWPPSATRSRWPNCSAASASPSSRAWR
jgi:HAE1 family hydrophobic/amphiphilic exporter-1